jgi:hypothetical protein
MCIVEQLRGGMGADERVNVGMIVICPSTGDVVWDEFEGKFLLSTCPTSAKVAFRWPYAHRARSRLPSSGFQVVLAHACLSDENGAL